MSVLPPSPGGLPPSKEPENLYEITFAVKDPITGEWNAAQLTQEKQADLDRYLRQMETVTKQQSVLQYVRRDEPGKEFQITEESIGEGDEVGKPLKERDLGQIDESFIGLVSSTVKGIVGVDHFRVGVKVVTPPLYFAEEQFIANISNVLKNWPPSELKGVSEDEKSVHKSKLESLKGQAEKHLALMKSVQEYLSAENTEKALDSFATGLKELSEPYRGAFYALHYSPVQFDRGHFTSPVELFSKALKRAKNQGVETKKAWTDAIEGLESANKKFSEKLSKERVAIHHISEGADTEMSVYERFRGFSQLYSQHEDRVRANLRARGLSDFDISYLLDPFHGAALAMERMSQGLEKVKKLAQDGQFSEAVKSYGKLIVDLYPTYCAALSKGVIAYKKASTIAGPLHEALKEISEFADFFASLRNIDTTTIMIEYVQRPPRHQMLFKEAMKKVEGLKIDIPEICSRAERVIAEENTKINEQMGEYHDLTEVSSLEVAEKRVVDQEVLGKNGWGKRDSGELTAICQAQANVYTPLYQGAQVLKSTERSQQRSVRSHLKQLLQKAKSRFEKTKKQFDDFRAGKKVAALDKAVADLRSGTKPEDNDTADKLEKSSAEVKSLKDNDTADKLEKFSSVVKSLTKHFEKRAEFMDALSEDLHVKMRWEPGAVEKSLSSPTLADLNTWHEGGWSSEDIKLFSRLYDSYAREMEPIFLARGELEEDPENLALQAEYEKIVDTQLPKLNKINSEIDRFGGWTKIKPLTMAIDLTLKFLDGKIAVFSQMDKEEKLKSQYQELQDQLKQAGFEKTLAERELVVTNAYQDLSVGLSGNIGYVKKLLIDSGLAHKLEFAFKEVKDLKALDKWNDTFVKEVSDLQRLQRKLEAHPGDEKTFQKLKTLIRRKKSQIESLKKEFEQWGGLKKVAALQNEIDGYAEVAHPEEKVVLERAQIYRMMHSRTEFLKALPLYLLSTSPFARVIQAA